MSSRPSSASLALGLQAALAASLALACTRTPAIPATGARQVQDGMPLWPAGFRLVAVARGERGEHVGFSLTTLGDVDGDKRGELVVGSLREAQPRPRPEGFVRVFSPARAQVLREVRSLDVTGDDGFGERVAVLGDVDADGANDYAVSAPDADGGRGAVEVHSGAGNRRLCLIQGFPPHERGLGRFIAAVGDVDRDGRNDLGAACDNSRSFVFDAQTGAAIASFDGTLRGATGDLDGDGRPELLVYDGEPRTRAMTWDGPPRSMRVVRVDLGSTSLAQLVATTLLTLDCGADARAIDAQSVADVDRDGFSDWVVALALGDVHGPLGETWTAEPRERRVRVISGRDGSVVRDFGIVLPGPGRIHFVGVIGDVDGDKVNELAIAWHRNEGWPQAVLELRRATDGVLTHEIASANWSFGSAVVTLPDIDGDGRNELAIGEFETALPARGSGAVYVVGCPLQP